MVAVEIYPPGAACLPLRSEGPKGRWVCFLVRFVQQLLLAKKEKTTRYPHPSGVVPINTIIGRGRHLRGFPVKIFGQKLVARLRTARLQGSARLRTATFEEDAQLRTAKPHPCARL